ncbi:MAG TPA: mitofilin family membrane protein [Roseiarcus sp.]|jgi:hypothetical protein
MIDEETKRDPAQSAGAPVSRDARPDPGVIEGEIAGRETSETEPPPEPSVAENGAAPRPAPAAAPRSGAHGFLGGALAGLIVSALALGAGYALLTPKTDATEIAGRLNDLEAEAQRDKAALADQANGDRAAIASLGKRVSALASAGASNNGADLDKRVAALEAAGAGNGAASDAAQHLAAEEKNLRADLDAARGAIPDLSARVAKLESETQKASAAAGDLTALTARVDKIESALAAPKPDARSPSDTAAAIAVIAEAAENSLSAGEPLGPEVAMLQRLGVDPAKLAPLQAVANGAPTNAGLAASFSAVAPKVLAATSQKESGGVADRFLAHLHSLVRVRDLNETAGDDPPALVSQIEALSRRGDIGGALAAFNKLPESARQPAGDWLTAARARNAADAALKSIREAAVAELAGGPKP